MPDDVQDDESPYRRKSDEKLDDAVAELKAYIGVEMQKHMKAGHTLSPDNERRIEEHDQMVVATKDTNEKVGRMAVMMEGKSVEDSDGNVLRHEGGMFNDVTALKAQSDNGGFKMHVKLTKPQQGMVIALMTALVYLVVEVLKLNGG